jgi:hypothetical protein
LQDSSFNININAFKVWKIQASECWLTISNLLIIYNAPNTVNILAYSLSCRGVQK